jgi:mRNA interferase MazF
VSDYVPRRGDLVRLTFDPRAGREQAGRRPALVLSLESYNARTGLMIACPITSKRKGYPFEVAIDERGVSGAVLADHVRSVDWHARRAELIAHSTVTVERVAALVGALIGLP